MTYISNKDFWLEVVKGNVAGHVAINKFGINPDIDTGTTEDLWTVGGTWVAPTSATTVNIVSSSVNDTAVGTGARTITVNGLNGSYADTTETITLNGTTNVTTVNSYFIIHRMTVGTAGSGATNAGAISTTWTGGGTPVGPSIIIGSAQTQFCIYQIPAGYTAYMYRYQGGMQNGTSADLKLYIKPFGGVFNIKGELALSASGTSYSTRDYALPLVITEKSIVKIVGTVTANNTEVHASFDIILVAN